jgi:pathogenesis-related protein 1
MKTTTITGGTTRHPQQVTILIGIVLLASLTACQPTSEATSPVPRVVEENRTSLLPAVPVTMPAASTERSGEPGKIDQAAMLSAHNRWRADVGSPALVWSEKLANIAQGWADHLNQENCAMYHSNNGYGENIYQASPLMWSDGRRDFQHKSPKEVTDAWGSEIKDYNYASNSCSGVCGHYTQLVWKSTKEVGCAMSVCGDNGQIWVCSYYPPGNVVGQKPY